METPDESFLRAAIAEAHASEQGGEVPVGAVIVHNGHIIATGQNRVIRDADPTAHAEIVALRAAGRALANYRLEDCDLYVTLEPCAMCAGAILHARIRRLIYAASDPKAGACGSALSVMNHPLLNHRVEVSSGLLADECGAFLTAFFRARRNAAKASRIQPAQETPNEDAETIAKSLASKEVSPKGPASGMRMLNFYINRAGKNLPETRVQELEKAKTILSEIIASKKPAKKAPAKKAAKKSAKKSATK
jgi:tRNA(adenine34) deaminase